MPIPHKVAELVERFQANPAQYKAATFNETELRREFLDPFFSALGWDVENNRGLSVARRDVSHEFGIKVEGDDGEKKNRAPDYAFRIGETDDKPVFFVEAKKPFVHVKQNDRAAFQVRQYGWSAKLPFCVLTDFEEFAVYDCRFKPVVTESAEKARVNYFTLDQYASNWDTIADLFGRDAVKEGALAKRALREQKKGTETVDAAFLKLIQDWRVRLAKDLVPRNRNLTSADLNFAVQMTIDRIIFLRMAEDRDLEEWGTLQKISRGKNVYSHLLELFADADDRYNSGLFHFPGARRSGAKKRAGFEDTLSPSLKISDEVLAPFIGGLYRPSPFNFRVMPIEILGQVYEQFLGKSIRLSLGKARAVEVEDKPEVRKAGGVYYTPAYIVDAIVAQTVGALCQGKTAKQVESLRVLDPACGSGSFLIGAYSFLLGWHLDFYSKDPEKHLKCKDAPLFAASDPQDETKKTYRLTTREKRRILLANIYGVDIDRQAVEVTKLSLLLRVLEDESSEGLKLLNEPALPDLESNIRCGNSLIGSDFYDTDKGGLDRDTLSDNEQTRINAFDWRTAFPFGFDAVIGNPPYIRIQALNEWAPLEVAHFKRTYATAKKGNYDIYVMFIERALQLMNAKGRLGFILPHKFFNAQYGEATRELLSSGQHLREVVHFGDLQVFDAASTYTCLLFADKSPQPSANITRVQNLESWRSDGQAITGQVNATTLSGAPWSFSIGESGALFDKLAAMPIKLGDIAHLFVGLQTDADDVFIVEEIKRDESRVLCASKATGKEHWLENDHLKPFLKGSLNIRRYGFADVTKRLIFPYEARYGKSALIESDDYKKHHPLTWKYLQENKERLSERNKGEMGEAWYGYVYKKNHLRFGSSKILVPSIATGSCFAPDLEGKYYFVGSGGGGGGGYGIILNEEFSKSAEYVLGILNSRLMSSYLKSISTPFRGGYLALNRQYIEQLPIPTINFADASQKKRHDDIVKAVEQMLSLKKQFENEKNPASKANVAARIASTDAKIDALVFEIYGLNKDEIALVSSS